MSHKKKNIIKSTGETHENLSIQNKNIKNYKMIFSSQLLDLWKNFHSTNLKMAQVMNKETTFKIHINPNNFSLRVQCFLNKLRIFRICSHIFINFVTWRQTILIFILVLIVGRKIMSQTIFKRIRRLTVQFIMVVIQGKSLCGMG